MTGLKVVAAAVLLLGVAFTPAAAQISEPAAFDAQNPGRSAINGGALTPWGAQQLATEHRGEAVNAYGAMPSATPSATGPRVGRRRGAR
ncbi:hypothetical protein UP10_20795 [Bradyrhizobium sp. LTSPM299]|uniref:hypothetical protein n=1 Tax=Bradyrhizobium sp. LTSPM299 TaxID=1619233 RepID=UPI0005C9F00A|nr:hypothetical protein [Bradyrhizobium sp. LTSPM299]KJC59043.1 hypothetical protein UP10_20795 [Bradyrhizobium sp. LTSPM299]